MFSKLHRKSCLSLLHHVVLHTNQLYYETIGESSKKSKKMQIITGIEGTVFNFKKLISKIKNGFGNWEVSYGHY